MEMEEFEKRLSQLSKPEISELKHQDMLTKSILNAKSKFVLSWWWLSIPIYIIAAFLMKSYFMPTSSWISGIHEFGANEKFEALIFFLMLPLIFLILNIVSIRKLYILLGYPDAMSLFKTAWQNILIVLISILVIIIYWI